MPDPSTGAPEADLEISLLGQFRVVVGGAVVPDDAWKLRKARALLKLLALAPGGRLPRERALDLLWPDLGPAAADNNLRGALFVARRVLAPAGLILARGGILELRAEGDLRIDTVAFERAADRAEGGRDPRAFAAALDHYPGDLLPDDRYEDWTLAPRERLRGRALALLAALAALHEAAGEWPGAIAALQRLVAAEPTDEAAHAGLIRLYARAGSRSRALAQWDTLVATLRAELDAAPAADTRALRDAIAAGQFPAAAEADAPPGREGGNLPIPLTPLIGREAAIVAVKAALAGARLVTLTGSGGAGKTRLALAVATALAAEWAGGVWWVELATLADPDLVPGAVAAALGVRAGPGQGPLDAISAALRARPTLLVLDNAEGLRAGVAALASALLTARPTARLLVTSRIDLGVPGEVVWRVPSLALPTAGDEAGPGALAAIGASPAVRLFVARARDRQPGFAIGPANAAAVAEIARRLDGIPLALELAAARVALLPPPALAARLDDALTVLADAGRAGPPRHRTMRATLDWSAALLTPGQRRLLARLGLFVGGGTLAAIEAICAEPPDASLLDDLGELVAHSLVGVTEGLHDTRADARAGTDEARYGLLEPTRQYAAALLAAAPDADTVRERHAAYYCALMAGADDGLIGPNHAMWTRRLDAERGNLRATLDHLARRGDAARGLPLAIAIWRYWDARGDYDEGRAWFDRFFAAAPAPGGALTPHWYARALFAAARLAHDQGASAEAGDLARRILALARAHGEAIDTTAALTLLGHIAFGHAHYADARRFHSEALTLRRAAGAAREMAISLQGLTMASIGEEDYAAAAATGEEALALALATGDRETAITTLLRLAAIARALGDGGRAAGYADEALAVARDFGVAQSLAHALALRADIALGVGDLPLARTSLAESFALLAGRARLPLLRIQLETATLLAAAGGDHALALRLGGATSALNDRLGHRDTPFLRARFSAALRAARAALPPAAAERASREGQILDAAAARDLAAEWAEGASGRVGQ